MTTKARTSDPESGVPGLGRTMSGLRRVFDSGRTRSLSWRTQQLKGIVRLVTDHEADFAQAIASDLGRGAVDAWLGDLAPAKTEAEYAIKHLRGWARNRRVSLPMSQLPGSGWIQHEPLGVVLVIGPWNYPVLLNLAPLISAIAAGNCAVVKPSELAPATSLLLKGLLGRYVDPEAVTVVEGDGATTQELLGLGFDHAFFTGGTEVGRRVMVAAAEKLTPVTLELGGKCPVIVAADAKLGVTARRIAWTKMMNAGQTCVAPDYVLVHEKVKDEFLTLLLNAMEEMRDPGETFQRIVNERHFDRLCDYLATTTGSVVAGGEYDRPTLGLAPSVVVDPDPADTVMTEEIFGPILPVLSYRTLDDAVSFVNARPKPLAMYLFSETSSVEQALIDRIPAGGVVVNHVAMHCMVPQLPFGGIGNSGMGAYHGEWGFQTFSHRKAVLRKGTQLDPQIVYPPYSSSDLRLLRKLF
ncbi:aldehyde dehydrogenase (NAD+) [Actinocorallia herbida]|uniref:Aldehyde dehydrogenase n=1 Tax=Actinocorallia herbida TaxID=58109 RepID=A0A3N1D438_9ACTN|nr:aldehyde dehydrogenase family protein [Actinocorallia herbida]ROO87838.1 aldehyde dehydrogenase (NAD+) [Actinocorallia herbida]